MVRRKCYGVDVRMDLNSSCTWSYGMPLIGDNDCDLGKIISTYQAIHPFPLYQPLVSVDDRCAVPQPLLRQGSPAGAGGMDLFRWV